MRIKLLKDIPWFNKKQGEILEVLGVYFRPTNLEEHLNNPNMIFICLFNNYVNEIQSIHCKLIDGSIPEDWFFYLPKNINEFTDGDYNLQITSIMSYPEAIENKQHLIRLYKQEKNEYSKFRAVYINPLKKSHQKTKYEISKQSRII